MEMVECVPSLGTAEVKRGTERTREWGPPTTLLLRENKAYTKPTTKAQHQQAMINTDVNGNKPPHPGQASIRQTLPLEHLPPPWDYSRGHTHNARTFFFFLLLAGSEKLCCSFSVCLLMWWLRQEIFCVVVVSWRVVKKW